MSARPNSKESDIVHVIASLRRQADKDGIVTANIFLDAGSGENFDGFVKRLVANARLHSGHSNQVFSIRKLHPFARSFSVTTTLDVIIQLGKEPGVRAILPSRIDDVYSKPVAHRVG